MHSSFLEIFVNQGLFGLLLMYLVYWHGFKRYRTEYRNSTALAPLFAGFCYLLFCWQIDITGFGYYLGSLLLFMMLAPMCIKREAITGKRKALNGEWLS